jgi:hypothetical protein
MIVYLGMPRCASSWLYEHLSHIETGPKETHHLYTSPDNLKIYCQKKLEFSTNNWSMDSDVARSIDPYVTKYLLIFRNPVELIESYQALFEHTLYVDFFIINKLLCFGDIVQRWVDLVGLDKIVVTNYDNLVKDPQMFIKDITTRLEVPLPVEINTQKINNAPAKRKLALTDSQVNVLKEQVSKLEKITNQEFNWNINNRL